MNCIICQSPMRARTDWLYRCPSCGFLQATLAAGAGRDVGGLDELRRVNFERILDRIGRILPVSGARILEVGCSNGLFLEAATARGAAIEGIEPDRGNAEAARRKGFAVTDGFFPDALDASKSYEIVIFNDVFEHFPDPVAALQATERVLAPGGLAIFNLPSAAGFLYRVADLLARCGMPQPFKRLWQYGQASPHLTYFTPQTLERFVQRYSSLATTDRFALLTMTRRGLRDRVFSTETGARAYAMFAALYAMTFVQEILPSDIHVLIVRKPG